MPRLTEPYLSVNWLEGTGASLRARQLAIVRQHLRNKGRTLSPKGRLAVLNLQIAFDHVRSGTPDARRLAAHHEPELPADPSHSGIYGYTNDDVLIADLLAEAVREVYPARE